MRGRIFAAVVTVGMLCDGLSSQDGFRWLTAPQRDGRRSAIGAASASVSGDGRYVAFASYARLTAADVDSLADIYVLDRSTATVTLESAVVEGRALKSDCSHPRISADGRYVAFEAIPSDDPERSGTEVVLRDRVENTARWIGRTRWGLTERVERPARRRRERGRHRVCVRGNEPGARRPERIARRRLSLRSRQQPHRAHQRGQSWCAAAGRQPDAERQRGRPLRGVRLDGSPRYLAPRPRADVESPAVSHDLSA